MNKTRSLRIYEYFEVLQVEYLSCKLRARIYLKPKDKEYWNRVSENKRQIITNISGRNGNLPTIFNDSDLQNVLEKRLYKENSSPMFVYKDEDHRKEQEYFDLLYYYQKGVEVRFTFSSNNLDYQIGIIKKYNPFDKKITILHQDQEYDIEIEKVVRIL